MSEQVLIPCIGCRALVPDIDSPTHQYIGASPGCWAVYGEVLAREYWQYRYPPVHRVTVDTYAVQHPGTPSRRSIQSVAVHLIGLFLFLERGVEYNRTSETIAGVLDRRTEIDFIWLDPPESFGPLTILDVARAANAAEHEDVVMRWAAAVWTAWQPHHETVRHWASVWRF